MKIRRKFKISLYKILNMIITPGFLLMQKENGNLNLFRKFQLREYADICQNGDFKFLKKKKN